jgi:hypothetical protein
MQTTKHVYNELVYQLKLMEKEWIPVIATLLGVSLGSVITWFIKWFELRHQRTQEHNKLMLPKLEQLYENILDFQRATNEYYVIVRRIAGNPITPEQIREDAINLLKPLNKINALLDLYARDLAPQFESVTAVTKGFIKYSQSCLKIETDNLDTLRDFYNDVLNTSEKLLLEVRDSSDKYIDLPKQTWFQKLKS